jgi:hypothetical protein
MTDPASFKEPDVLRLLGPTPLCVLTLSYEVELHHILGRGELFGFGWPDPERAYFSSLLNCAPLVRMVHHGPKRDHPYMRRMLLEEARTRVMEAVGQREYELSANDRGFLKICDKWLSTAE